MQSKDQTSSNGSLIEMQKKLKERRKILRIRNKECPYSLCDGSGWIPVEAQVYPGEEIYANIDHKKCECKLNNDHMAYDDVDR